MSESAEIAWTAVTSVLIITSIVGNSLVCAVIKKNRDMRYITCRQLTKKIMTSQSRHYFSCLGLSKLKKKTLIVMIYFSLGGGIDQQISVFSFTFSPPWLLKQNSFFRNHAILFSIFYFLFLV